MPAVSHADKDGGEEELDPIAEAKKKKLQRMLKVQFCHVLLIQCLLRRSIISSMKHGGSVPNYVPNGSS